MSELILIAKDEDRRAEDAKRFCAAFLNPSGCPRYVLGRNVYSEKIIDTLTIDGVIDDFADIAGFKGVPVLKSDQIPSNALVVVASGGRPISAKKKLVESEIKCLDYFSFLKFSGLPLIEVVFNEGFNEDFDAHQSEYEWVYNLLADEKSRQVYRQLVSFRIKYDLGLLEGFTPREDEQYFEDFLELQEEGESFADIGCFDGFTSLEFIKRCPKYVAVHIFEPDPSNYEACKKNLSGHENIHFHKLGLSDKKQTLRFDTQGSASKITGEGQLEINVDRLDDITQEPLTLVKMDIEGAELGAVEGARETILRDHPRLAISVYHCAGDFWKIPKVVLSIREDYDVYLRHYTESIYETIMFFMPKK